jgi:hypothetical protein
MNLGSTSSEDDHTGTKETKKQTMFAAHDDGFRSSKISSATHAHSAGQQKAGGIIDPIFLCDIPADILSSILEKAGIAWNLLACRSSLRMRSIATNNIDGLVALDLSMSPW